MQILPLYGDKVVRGSSRLWRNSNTALQVLGFIINASVIAAERSGLRIERSWPPVWCFLRILHKNLKKFLSDSDERYR